jgi:hypothetical protein
MNRRDLLLFSAGAALPLRTFGADWKPAALNAHQNETVIVLTELIIPATDTPGAKAALVNRYIDQLLGEGPAAERDRFLEGLKWLDEYATRIHMQPFVRCAPAEQTAILRTLDAGGDAEVEAGHRFFRMTKQLTARIYYATQAGFRELNKGGRVPSTFACKHPEHA